MKFEAVRIHFLCEFFGLLLSKKIVTTATWHKRRPLSIKRLIKNY